MAEMIETKDSNGRKIKRWIGSPTVLQLREIVQSQQHDITDLIKDLKVYQSSELVLEGRMGEMSRELIRANKLIVDISEKAQADCDPWRALEGASNADLLKNYVDSLEKKVRNHNKCSVWRKLMKAITGVKL